MKIVNGAFDNKKYKEMIFVLEQKELILRQQRRMFLCTDWTINKFFNISSLTTILNLH